MSIDLGSLLKKPAGQAKKPPALDAGNYPGIVKGFEIGDQNKNKTPYVRFQVGLLGWPEGAEADAEIDLSKRQLRRDYFLTDDALWRLDEFIRSCNIESNGRSYEEVLPELTGAHVVVEVQQYMNQTSNEIGNQIGKMTGSQ